MVVSSRSSSHSERKDSAFRNSGPRFFDWPIEFALAVYFVTEAAYAFLSRHAPGMPLEVGAVPPHARSFALLAVTGSALSGLLFVTFRRRVRFGSQGATSSSVLSRAPWLYALASGICLGAIVCATSYFLAEGISSVLQVAIFLRSSVIAISWLVDRLHFRLGYLAHRQLPNDHYAVLAALAAVAITALTRRTAADDKYAGSIAALVVLYCAAYAIRLHLMNRFKQLQLVQRPEQREAYFSWEQIGLSLAAAAGWFIFSRMLDVKLDWEPPRAVEMVLAGGLYFLAGLAGVSVLVDPARNATRAGLLTRLTAIGANMVGGLALFVALGTGSPRPFDVFALLFFVTACFLVAAAEDRKRATDSCDASGRARDTTGAVKLSLMIVASYFYLVQVATNLRLISASPFRDELNLFALLGESAIQSAMSALPFVFGAAVFFLVFMSRRMGEEAAAIFGRLTGTGKGSAEKHGNGASKESRSGLAMQRLGWVLAIVTATLGIITWAYDVPARRLEVTSALDGGLDMAQVREGRETLRTWCRNIEKDTDCEFCRVTCALLSRDHEVSGAGEVVEDVVDSNRTRWNQARSALNFAEEILALRACGALSEVEFQSAWAGVADEICHGLRYHLYHGEGMGRGGVAAASTNKMAIIRMYTPLLFDRARALEEKHQRRRVLRD